MVSRSSAGGRGYRLLAAALAAVALAGCTSGGGNSGGSGPPPALRGNLYTGPVAHGSPTPFGMKWDWARVDAYGPYLRQLSGSATFYQFSWCEIEPRPGQRDWSSVDAVVRASDRLGYPLFLKVRVGSCWATGGQVGTARGDRQKTASAPPRSFDAYAEFVRATAARYAPMGVHEWAIENEVNAKNFWTGTPAQYEELVRRGSAALRAADPKARVLDGGISSTAYGVGIADRLLARGEAAAAVAAYSRYYARRFDLRAADFPRVRTGAELASALRGEQPRRNLDYLEVTFRLIRDRVVDADQLHFYESWDNVPALLDYLRSRLPPSFPVEAWEVGQFWPDGPADESVRGAEMVKSLALLLGGGIRRVIWLPLAFNAEGRQPAELRFGLLDPKGVVRPAGRAFATLVSAARGASWQPVRVAGGGAGVAFARAGSTVLVVWGGSGARLRPLPGAATSVRTVTGDYVPVPPGGLSLGTLPVVVSVAGDVSVAIRMVS
ncbi:MAG: hypothetical protein ACR2J0_05140 [Mycobacteriales bacterium]